MNIQKFKLKSVLSYRKFLKMQAASRLAEAALKRLEAHETLVKLSEMLSDIEHQFEVSYEVSAQASDLLIIQRALAEQRKRIKEAHIAHEEAQELERSSRQQVLVTQQEYESILKLEEKHREKVRAEVLRSEESAMSEFTMARFKHSSKI